MTNYLKFYHFSYLLAKRINLMYKMRRKKLLGGVPVRGWLEGQSRLWPTRYPAYINGLFTPLLLPQVLMTAECMSGLDTVESYWRRALRKRLCLLPIHMEMGHLRRPQSRVRPNQSPFYVCCFWEFTHLCTVAFSCIDFLCSSLCAVPVKTHNDRGEHKVYRRWHGGK